MDPNSLSDPYVLPSSPARQRRGRRRAGTLLVLMAVLMVAFFATVVFSVDVAYMFLVETQLRSATDAAAKAAADTLTRTESVAAARTRAQEIAELNLVAGRGLLLDDEDIEFGSASIDTTTDRVTFVPNSTPFSAARVTGRKTADSRSGNVRLFFGGILGRPRFDISLSATGSRRDRDISLVIDRSGSMLGQKLSDLKEAIIIFLASLEETPQEELVGLSSYSTLATRDASLTDELSVIAAATQRLVAAGTTNIGGGIDVGRAILNDGRSSQFVDKTIILMTDGIHNTGTDPIQAARRAAADGTVIHAITFGAGADQARMRQVAQITGGQFFHAPNGAALKRIYREIALTLQTQLTD